LHYIVAKNYIFKAKDNVPVVKLKEKKKNTKKILFFASLKIKSLKKGVGSGSGSISQRYRSGDPDPHCRQHIFGNIFSDATKLFPASRK
jgi:hypothetical protein